MVSLSLVFRIWQSTTDNGSSVDFKYAVCQDIITANKLEMVFYFFLFAKGALELLGDILVHSGCCSLLLALILSGIRINPAVPLMWDKSGATLI